MHGSSTLTQFVLERMEPLLLVVTPLFTPFHVKMAVGSVSRLMELALKLRGFVLLTTLPHKCTGAIS